jgi:hypothetical protein
MSKLEVDAIEPQSGTTITIGSSGDTVNLVGTLQSNGSPLPGDISSVVAGTGLSGGGTTGAVTLNIEAAQPTITSTGTLTGFTSTGIDDNASGTSLTIASDGRTTLDATNEKSFVVHHSDGSNVRIGMNNDTTNSNEIAYEGTDFVIKPGGTEKARLTTTGLGIGTSAPAENLQVMDTASNIPQIRIETSDGGNKRLDLYVESSVGTISSAQSAQQLAFKTAGGEAVRVDSTGQVGIGTSSPSQPLHVYSTGNDIARIETNQTEGRLSLKDATGDAILKFRNDYRFTNSTGELARLNASGNFGIGTTAPSGPLHVVGSATTNQITFENTDGGTASAPDVVLYRNSSSPANNDALGRIHFRGKSSTGALTNYAYMYATSGDVTNGSEDGNLFIGGLINGADRGWLTLLEYEVVVNDDSNDLDFRVESNANTHALFVRGSDSSVMIGASSIPTSGTTVNGIQLKGGSDTNFFSVDSSGGQEQMRFINPNGRVGSIRTNGSNTSFETSSDYRLKENVNYDFDATTRLKQLKPARFNFIADADTTVDGFIAHEVQSIIPEAVSGTHNQVEVWKDNEELPEGVSVGDNKLDDDGNTIPYYQGIDQSKLVPLLVKTIQELEARITTLENA